MQGFRSPSASATTLMGVIRCGALLWEAIWPWVIEHSGIPKTGSLPVGGAVSLTIKLLGVEHTKTGDNQLVSRAGS